MEIQGVFLLLNLESDFGWVVLGVCGVCLLSHSASNMLKQTIFIYSVLHFKQELKSTHHNSFISVK